MAEDMQHEASFDSDKDNIRIEASASDSAGAGSPDFIPDDPARYQKLVEAKKLAVQNIYQQTAQAIDEGTLPTPLKPRGFVDPISDEDVADYLASNMDKPVDTTAKGVVPEETVDSTDKVSDSDESAESAKYTPMTDKELDLYLQAAGFASILDSDGESILPKEMTDILKAEFKIVFDKNNEIRNGIIGRVEGQRDLEKQGDNPNVFRNQVFNKYLSLIDEAGPLKVPDIEKFKGFDIGHDKLGAFKYIQSDPVLMKGITGFHKDFVKVQDTVVNHIQSTRFHQTAGEKLGGVGAKILSSGQPNADENARIATLFERHVRSSGTIEFAAVKKADFGASTPNGKPENPDPSSPEGEKKEGKAADFEYPEMEGGEVEVSRTGEIRIKRDEMLMIKDEYGVGQVLKIPGGKDEVTVEFVADGEVLDLRKKNSFYVYIDLLNEDKERIGPGGRIEMQAGRLSNEKMTVHAELPDEAAFIKVRHPAYAFTGEMTYSDMEVDFD